MPAIRIITFSSASRIPAKRQCRFELWSVGGAYQLQVNRWPSSPLVKSNPSHRWQDATQIPLGKTIFASGDDAEYIPLPGTPRGAAVSDPSGVDWYKFEFSAGAPKLVFFQVDLMERDQIPVNVSVYRLVDGEPEEYFEGEDPVTLPHEVQALPGNKFTPRILNEKGTYYVAVRANHPEYKLRTRVYDPPPYRIRAWPCAPRSTTFWPPAIPGTPTRRGAAAFWTAYRASTRKRRSASPATRRTFRCAPSCTRRATAIRWSQRQQLQFLTERFYNNPRPFYGFEEQGAVVGAHDLGAGQRAGPHVAPDRYLRDADHPANGAPPITTDRQVS